MDDITALLDTDAALKPLLEAAQESASSNVSTIRALVFKVLSSTSIFCGFDQIKAVLQPALSTGEGETLLRTLDLFSYGKYNDYSEATSGQYLSLTDSQLLKLRQLTVMSVVQEACCRGEGVITYDILAQELGFMEPNLRQVEEIVISCIYAHILQGCLCQKTKSLLITSDRGPPCRSRDVPASQVPIMIATLQALCARLEASHADLETSHTTVQSSLDQNTAYWSTVDERKKKAETQVASQGATVRNLGGWPEGGAGAEAAHRSSSSRRQSKRSRGGLGGSITEPFQRY
jgi:COP9 signalosome complex subunit 7